MLSKTPLSRKVPFSIMPDFSENIAVVSEVIMRPAARPFYTGYGMYPDPGTRIRKDTVYTDSLGRFRVEFCAERPGEDGPGNAVEVRIQAVDMTGETQEKATFLPISPYRYRINATPRNQREVPTTASCSGKRLLSCTLRSPTQREPCRTCRAHTLFRVKTKSFSLAHLRAWKQSSLP